MFILKLTIFSILFIIAGSTHRNSFNKEIFNHYHQKITDSEYIYACFKPLNTEELPKCQQIREFTISDNISFTCYDEYLPINFEIDFQLKNSSFVKTKTYGFLSQVQGFSTFYVQSWTSSCQKIKK